MLKAKLMSLVGHVPVMKSLGRWYANRYPEGSVTTVRAGYARGLKWKRHHRYINSFWVGNFEIEVQRALARELRSGNHFLDVGANAGLLSLVGWKVVGPQGRVTSVDPDPVNHEALSELIELNNCSNWQLRQVAVSDSTGTGSFSRSKPGSPMGKLGTVAGAETIDVKLATLDQLIEEVGVPDVIKMDIEGAEVAALRGAKELLARHAPKWLIELHSDECGRGVREILAANGYRFSDIDGTGVPASASLPGHVIAIKEP
jgi:FkbM family methyltransferase